MKFRHRSPFGAELSRDGVRFRLYAPAAEQVELLLEPGSAQARGLATERREDGFFERFVEGARAGCRYAFRIDGRAKPVPDPASRYQPDGVHEPSSVVDPHAFEWPDNEWRGRPWNEHVFYELHLGTFTPEGTYAAARAKLDHLVRLGVTAVELMPLAEVPGTRNWGYDGVLLYAPTRNYGSPEELKRFVATAHAKGLGVWLDVVYNHFGPEGNYLHQFAPNFYTEKHRTPWGAAIDFESDGNAAVRAFFIENALYWLEEYRFDGLRLDAVHAIFDERPRPFLIELAQTVHARAGRPIDLVLENDSNQARFLREGYRAQWNDDVHHCLHVAATGEVDGYYADYAERPVALLGRALCTGFAYQGEPSSFRDGLARGEPSADYELLSFVNFLQNHDQIGNRAFGERITALAPEPAVRAALAVLLLAPSPPLLFMGEEWGAASPFLFFADFEPELARLVTEGRRNEFARFGAFADPAARERIPDPAAPQTFERSKLDWQELSDTEHHRWLDYYQHLLQLRRVYIWPRIGGLRGTDAAFSTLGARGLCASWRSGIQHLRLEANLGPAAQAGFPEKAPGATVFATHETGFAGGTAAPWSVRWSVE